MKTVVFLADGFEECEGLIVVDILRRAGIETVMASVTGKLEVDSSRHIIVKADALAEDVDFDSVDLIVLPGGRLGTENLGKSRLVRETCVDFAAKKHVAAICAAPTVLADLGLLEKKSATCHPDFENQMAGAILTHSSVAVEDNIITGQGLGASFDFSFEIVRQFMGEKEVRRIKKSACFAAPDCCKGQL